MKCIVSNTLDSAQKAAIRSLVHTCLSYDHIRLSFPFDDGKLFLFWCEDSEGREEPSMRVLSAMAFVPDGAGGWECSAFTAPEHRRLGLFSSLLESGLSEIPEDSDVFFYTDPSCRAAAAALAALGAKHISDEHMMELAPGKFPECFAKDAGDAGHAPLTSSSLADPDGPTLHFTSPNGEVFIACHTSFYYLYGLEIAPDRRGRGLGTRLLLGTLSALFSRDPKPIRLQVSGRNEAALSLYKKTGFRITETLSCYLY